MKVLKKSGSAKLKAMTIRLPGDLAAELHEVRQFAKSAGLEFPTNEVCAEALRAAVTRAQSDLAAMPQPVDVRQQYLPIVDSPESTIGASNFAPGGSN